MGYTWLVVSRLKHVVWSFNAKLDHKIDQTNQNYESEIKSKIQTDSEMAASRHNSENAELA